MDKIDLTGFINEEIEVVIGDKTYNIPTDPDVESWIFILHYISGKFKAEEFVEAQRKILISLIVNNNKDKKIDLVKLKEKLGATAVENFIRPYMEILIKKGVLKKVIPRRKGGMERIKKRIRKRKQSN